MSSVAARWRSTEKRGGRVLPGRRQPVYRPGWADPTAVVFHVLGAIVYTFVLLRVVTWTSGYPAATLLFVGAIGVAGNVAYGFNTIHVSLGDTDLVDATGAAVLIKPLGLCFPLKLLLAAIALRKDRPAWLVILLGVAALAWLVAHIANIGWLAVVVNVALVVAFSALAAATRPAAVRTDQKEPLDGSYVLVGTAAGVKAASYRALIIAYKLGANGKLPGTVR